MGDKVQFKAYTYRINQTKPEIRRFGIEKGVVANFCYLEAKLQEIFPSLKQKCFSVTWKDEDGDDITISSDDEMIIALSSMTDNVMKLNIYCSEDESQEINIDVEITASTENATGDKNAVHCGVVCDVCDAPVAGFRYKCAICPNYDLCSKCEADGHHSQHIMVRFPMPKMSRSLVKAAMKRSRHVMKSMSNAAADVQELYERAKYERSSEKKRNHGRGEHSRRPVSWFDIFNSYLNEFADLAGNGGLDTNGDKSPKPAASGSQQEPQTSENAASFTSKQNAEAAVSEPPYALNLDKEKVKNFLRVICEISDVDSEGKRDEQSNVDAEGGAGTSDQTAEAIKEDAKAEISSTTKDVNEATTSKDVSPERATDEWTVINKEKDLMGMEQKPMGVEQKPMDIEQKTMDTEQKPMDTEQTPMDMEQTPNAPVQKNVPICYTLPQEFEQQLRIVKEQPYPTLRNGTTVLHPNQPQVTPWDVLTKEDWETEFANLTAQNNYDFDLTQTESQYQSHSFMPQYQAKTALQQTQPLGFRQNNNANAGQHQTHDFKYNYRPKAGLHHAKPQGFKPNKPNNDKAKAGLQQPQPAQSSHIKPHIAAAIEQMLAMGFSNEGGWLTQLLEGTGGNIAAVIELLTPVKPK